MPIGGGGLISGVATVAKAINPRCEVIGVELEVSNAFQQSVRAGRLVEIVPGETLADGLGGNPDPETITFAFIQRLVDRIVTVSEPDLAAAIVGLVEAEHVIAEGAGAAATAALVGKRIDVRDRQVGVIVSGGNIDRAQARERSCSASPTAEAAFEDRAARGVALARVGGVEALPRFRHDRIARDQRPRVRPRIDPRRPRLTLGAAREGAQQRLVGREAIQQRRGLSRTLQRGSRVKAAAHRIGRRRVEARCGERAVRQPMRGGCLATFEPQRRQHDLRFAVLRKTRRQRGRLGQRLVAAIGETQPAHQSPATVSSAVLSGVATRSGDGSRRAAASRQ